jgi:hypothetical protein
MALSLVTMLAACDTQSEDAATSNPGASRRVGGSEAAKLAAHMVSAVNTGTEKSTVELKFELTQRPEVDKPLDIALAFIPTSRLDRLSARFTAAEGLEVVKGAETEQFARPVVGSAITHTLTVIPKRDGIFSIQAVVLMDSESESVSRQYLIPLIAGSGIAEWSPKKVASRGDDTG